MRGFQTILRVSQHEALMLKAMAITGTVASAGWHFAMRWPGGPTVSWPGYVLTPVLMVVWIPMVIRLGTTAGRRRRVSSRAWTISAVLVAYAVGNSFFASNASESGFVTLASGHLMAFYGIAAAHLWRRS